MLKRLIDIILSACALIIFSPAMLYVSWKISRSMGLPVIFRQTRPGKDGKPFEMIKFRTMKNAMDKSGNFLPDNERLTPFGLFLRRTSLDELPEFWNVLKGDMSLVGPRPLLMQYLPLYSAQQFRRHEVKPGITGWAQINGRNAISWDEKFIFDVWYVDNNTLWLDFKILILTVKKVIFREGISADDHATMPFFEGSDASSLATSREKDE
ncbi:sugar transferase [Sansalvadorimonas sp. 2012CJ34-2]|uniref:Sugar transferase n=1 Tax=Parendozoicomonas callyspongiae TaxID=2942213 RepID=A0ABT0PL32_9GAMM|nr:sugar transferase [Sansalvadorimonas sp. 2012CJ34-2]MCL6272048.1 sugar transferase [Sansalvadorimonas sp. 2012CJ34-2]